MVGQIYGNILARNADADGYAYCVDLLTNGTQSVRDIVKTFATSEEFRELYVMNQTPNELAQRLLSRFSRSRKPTPPAIKELAVMLTEKDWREVVGGMIESTGYAQVHGDDKVPLWV